MPGIIQRLQEYFSLGERWAEPATIFAGIIWRNLRAGNLSILWRPSVAGDEAFGKWWLDSKDGFYNYEKNAGVPELVAHAHGTVLDLGAGSGNQLYRMQASQLKRVYGLESNPAFAEALSEAVKETGLEGVYTPIICSVEDAEAELAREGVTPGTVDCVLSIQLLCSVGDPEALVKKMHSFLKPGGEFIFWEHKANESDWMTRIAQGIWTVLWAPVVGQCRLNQQTRKAILAAADWDIVEFNVAEEPLDLMPRVWGRLKKKADA
ncbi:hypothetical protein K4F52_008423 [Lecanicillium sp. MT-2017a]|nr:hypothetical protein K4F52_008423 [Lecanicillium sp. MT-2017a]